MTSFTILNNLYLAKVALKCSEGRPDLLWGHLLSLELAVGSDLKTYKNQMTPYTIPNNLYLAKNALK